ncbi:MAG: carboxypeptidase regulatory-like domain-containing protein, partial [Gammaproteobacteria bacterium]|nr:carboxypeptidase regulatory-like domain-containing protein [Gammaproteobacteria bacterium]
GADPFDPDSDDDGILDGADTQVLIADITAPVIELISPTLPLNAVSGDIVRLKLAVTDNGQVASVVMTSSLGGDVLATVTQQPYEFDYAIDGLNNTYNLYFTASDVSGNVSTLGPVDITLITDPLAQVTGTVVDELSRPIQGAKITYADAVEEFTDIAGQFSLNAIPTTLNPLAVTISALFGNQLVTTKIEVELQRDNTIDIGTVELTPKGRAYVAIDHSDLVVGHFNTYYNNGDDYQIAPIEAAGLVPRNVGDITTADLSKFDILFVSKSYTSSSWPDNDVQAKVAAFVADGGIILMTDTRPDRHIILPGLNKYFRLSNSSIELATAEEAFTNGPGGAITDMTVDAAGRVANGYADASQVPTDTVALLTTEDINQLVTFAYPYESGAVIYTTIDMYDYPNESGSAFVNTFAPNILNYASKLYITDTDKDGLSDYAEIIENTDYLIADTDGDGLRDGFEI